MDVNSPEYTLTQKEFKDLAETSCRFYADGWKCNITGYACKDYLCAKVRKAKTVDEVKKNFN
jgi:hypothetical protein